MPIKFPKYKNDPFKDVILDPPEQMLTENGVLRAQELGYKLRTQYNSFLGEYKPHQVEAITSPVQRCKDTLSNVSKTLFLLNGDMMIPYKTVEPGNDKLLATYASCRQIFESEQYKFTDHDEVEFFEHLAKYIGSKITNYRDAIGLYDYIKVMDEVGYQMPRWARDVNEDLKMFASKFWEVLNKCQGANAAGNLLHKIARDSSYNKFTSNAKVHLYSGHDYNINTLLGLLDNYNGVEINYCSYIIFEVYKPAGGENFLQIYLDNNDEYGRIQLEIPGFGHSCTVSQFMEYAEIFYLGKNWCMK